MSHTLDAEPDPDWVGWTLRDDACPLEGAVSVDVTTGEVAWRPTCKSARCKRCSRQVSAQTFALARRAMNHEAGCDGHGCDGCSKRRVRFITLTRAPEGWQETRDAMKVWLKHLRRAGYTMHVLWVVERGSDTGMKHVHVVQWGSFIPKEVLSASWPYGSTQIEAARAASDYLAKGVLRYVAKELDGGEASLVDHMNLNGGRAGHWSREFYAGLSRDGYRKSNPLPGIYFVGAIGERKDVQVEDVDAPPGWTSTLCRCGCQDESGTVSAARRHALGWPSDSGDVYFTGTGPSDDVPGWM